VEQRKEKLRSKSCEIISYFFNISIVDTGKGEKKATDAASSCELCVTSNILDTVSHI